jgi:hypothetical protein
MNKNNQIKFKIQQIESTLKAPLKQLGIIKKQDWGNISPIFIISTGRTGTHFFTNFFNENFRNVFAIHEPQKDVFELNHAFLKGEVSLNKAGDMFKEFRKGILNHLNKNSLNIYVESNNNLSYLIPVLRSEFPNYKIIYIQRDGRDFVRSAYSKNTKGKWVGEVPFLSKKDPRNRLNPSFLKDDLYSNDWDNLSRFENICWNWSRKDSLIYNEVYNDSKTIILKFENLFVTKQPSEWNRLIDFLDLRKNIINENILSYMKANKSNQTKTFKLPEWKQWTEEQKRQFIKIAGEHMSNLGYTTE